MFAEMRALAEKDPSIAPEEILKMATVNAARALGLAGKIGELSSGALADLIAIPFSGASAKVHAAVLQHSGKVTASMIGGRWVIPPAG
jgi:cytosine/adenosine deaminase-related metal-dependent hydrolase